MTVHQLDHYHNYSREVYNFLRFLLNNRQFDQIIFPMKIISEFIPKNPTILLTIGRIHRRWEIIRFSLEFRIFQTLKSLE